MSFFLLGLIVVVACIFGGFPDIEFGPQTYFLIQTYFLCLIQVRLIKVEENPHGGNPVGITL